MSAKGVARKLYKTIVTYTAWARTGCIVKTVGMIKLPRELVLFR